MKPLIYTSFFLFLIAAFYFFFKSVMPDSGKDVVPIGKVAKFKFVNQDDQYFTNKDVEGKIYITNFFFTSCKGICPVMNDNLKQVHERFKNNRHFLIVSYTSDPQTDSVGRLKHYSDSLKADNKKWIFLTGRKDSLYNMARYSYHIDDENTNLTDINDDFIHSQNWALVDTKGDVVGIYDGLSEKEIKRLIKKIDILLSDAKFL